MFQMNSRTPITAQISLPTLRLQHLHELHTGRQSPDKMALADRLPRQRMNVKKMKIPYLSYFSTENPMMALDLTFIGKGSVLGPILWNVMYDTILRLRLDEGVRIIGLADDIAVVAVAGTTYEVEDLLSHAIAGVRGALWGLGLETADHKTDALLISRKRRLETITIEVGDCFIAFSPCIRYLGLQLDARLTFNDHLRAASEKASRVAGALSQIMPTIGGPRSSRRRLYANVIDSILLYGAPIWSSGTGTRAGTRRAEAIHRRACLCVISGRPHLSYEASYVLASGQGKREAPSPAPGSCQAWKHRPAHASGQKELARGSHLRPLSHNKSEGRKDGQKKMTGRCGMKKT
ncbi:unnamed protein product [Trichogramma brassicae]|uniref:Reverse transcriptase domain-containing protein n=1 Tax=Trichogramma brassicae TaxID=86971 RepID=A0A6H5HZG6_9HYME|nr:unnamed protein product [Trichogramma brassicae]